MKKSKIQVFNREKMLTIFSWNFEIEERSKGVQYLDLGETFPSSFQIDPNSNEYLLAEIGVDTA